MATSRWSLGKNQPHIKVVRAVGAATVTSAVEITVDTAIVKNKADAMKTIGQILSYIKAHDWV